MAHDWRPTPRSVLACAALLGLACIGTGAFWAVHASARQDATGTPVLVELFTSEGCSSCPPADELLIRLDEQQPVAGAQIIVVSEHVDYWDGLGWRDPFSSIEFTQRQDVYRQALGLPASYTPQMVVDGQTELIGSLDAKARRAIARAVTRSKAVVSVQPTGPAAADGVAVRVRVTKLPRVADGETADLWIAVTERGLETNVLRGENARRRLRHSAVARRLTRVEPLPAVMPATYDTTIRVALDPAWNRDRLGVVAFIQESSSRHVIGAAQATLAP